MCNKVFRDAGLDELFENIVLGEPDSKADNECLFQVWLFAAVRSPTAEPLDGSDIGTCKGSNWER